MVGHRSLELRQWNGRGVQFPSVPSLKGVLQSCLAERVHISPPPSLPLFIFMSKIKEFFSNFWWLILVPAGLFIFHLLFKKETPELDRQIKEKKKDVKKQEKEAEKAEEKAEESEEDLKDSIRDAQETSIRVSTKAEERDKQAEEFFR